MKNPAAGGGRWVDVQPARFPTWVTEFGRRHGDAAGPALDESGAVVTVIAADGAIAECHVPFPPVRVAAAGRAAGSAGLAGLAGLAGSTGWPEALAAHALADRTVGVLLARLGGYAVGVFAGAPPVLVASKTGSRPVHGRSAAGGWSQHRFARRREKQASEALQAAADAAVTVFGDARSGGARSGGARSGDARVKDDRLDAVVLGGDRRAVAGLADDPRLRDYLALATDRFLTVPDPKLAVLRETPRAFLAIRVRVIEPADQ
jgi:hypothetical protein